MGYLSCNYFGNGIGFSHAGISAEGDNAVLMQKVAKELLASLKSGNTVYPKKPWNGGFCTVGLVGLVRLREQVLAKELAVNIQAKLSKGEALFDVWMVKKSSFLPGFLFGFLHDNMLKIF